MTRYTAYLDPPTFGRFSLGGRSLVFQSLAPLLQNILSNGAETAREPTPTRLCTAEVLEAMVESDGES